MGIESSLIYEEILKDSNSNYRVTIGGLTGGSVSGVLNAPMPIAGGNEYESAGNALALVPFIGAVKEFGDSLSKALRIIGKDTTQSIEQTRKIWQESRNPQLSIEMTFWHIDSNSPSPVSMVNQIYSGLFPVRKSTYIVSAPLGYKFTNSKGDATGTLNLTIGKWFRADNLVMMDANFTPSLEVGPDGTPLYFTGTVTLEPYKMITYKEYMDWFRKPTSAAGGGSTDKAIGPVNDLLGSFKKLY